MNKDKHTLYCSNCGNKEILCTCTNSGICTKCGNRQLVSAKLYKLLKSLRDEKKDIF